MDMKCPRCGDERIGHRCDDILGVSQMTNEQQNAEKIAEFLGVDKSKERWKFYTLNDRNLWNITQQIAYKVSNEWDFKSWLASDSGTVAMIEKIRSDAESVDLLIPILRSYGNSLNPDLQAAILELLEEG